MQACLRKRAKSANGVQKSLIDIMNHVSMSRGSIVTTKSPFAEANNQFKIFTDPIELPINVNRIIPTIRKTPTKASPPVIFYRFKWALPE